MSVCVCVCVCQVCLLILSSRSVIESGDMFIRVAMTLDTECQFDIRDMMTGLMEPGHLITDADVTQLLTMPRGMTLCLSVCSFFCLFVLPSVRLSVCCVIGSRRIRIDL